MKTPIDPSVVSGWPVNASYERGYDRDLWIPVDPEQTDWKKTLQGNFLLDRVIKMRLDPKKAMG